MCCVVLSAVHFLLPRTALGGAGAGYWLSQAALYIAARLLFVRLGPGVRGSQGEADILESRAEAAPAQRNPSWNFVIAATCNLSWGLT